MNFSIFIVMKIVFISSGFSFALCSWKNEKFKLTMILSGVNFISTIAW